jgi:hypothetical protein
MLKQRLFQLLISLVLISTTAEARTLVISDIDDTLKLAAVKYTSKAIGYSFDDESGFLGMSALFNQIEAYSPNEFEFHYVTKAPAWFMEKTHKAFLTRHSYPAGLYWPAESAGDDQHKLRVIRHLIAQLNPDRILFIGDNGELDAQVYNQIETEFPKINFLTFIRHVYSDSVGDGRLSASQIGFLTPVEVSLELAIRGWLDWSAIESIKQSIIPAVMRDFGRNDDGIVSLASWQDCSQFKWKKGWASAAPWMIDMQVHLIKLCAIPRE